MIQTLKKLLLIFVLCLISNSTFAINLDNEVCALYEGATCGSGTEMFLIHMRQGNNDTNRDRCTRLPAICKAPDIDTWIRMYHESGGGRRGYRTSYTFATAKIDQTGVLTDLKGRSFVRCFKKRRGADWETQVVALCGEVPPQPCANGKVLVNNVCKSPPGRFETDNSNSAHGYQVSQALVGLAAAHNNGASQIVANPYNPGNSAGNVPGENGNTTGVDSGIKGPTYNDGPVIANDSSGGSGGFGGKGSSSQDALNKEKELASLGQALDPNATAGSGTAVGVDGSGARSQGGQSITNPDVLPGNAGPGTDTIDVTGRGLASLDANALGRGKSSQDPDDYFTRTQLNASLFKIVTSRLRQEQADWILTDKPKRLSPQRSTSSAR